MKKVSVFVLACFIASLAPVSAPRAEEIKDRLGYLPEEKGLYKKMKVGEIVEFMGELRGLSRAEARKRGGAWLERLGLGNVRWPALREIHEPVGEMRAGWRRLPCYPPVGDHPCALAGVP